MGINRRNNSPIWARTTTRRVSAHPVFIMGHLRRLLKLGDVARQSVGAWLIKSIRRKLALLDGIERLIKTGEYALTYSPVFL